MKTVEHIYQTLDSITKLNTKDIIGIHESYRIILNVCKNQTDKITSITIMIFTALYDHDYNAVNIIVVMLVMHCKKHSLIVS